MLFVYGIALVLLAVLLIFATQLKSPAEIMTPPGLYGQNADIQQAFEASVSAKGASVTLKYPSEGQYRSSFVMYDLDSDGEEEALVFYNLKSDEATVHVNILDKRNDEWQSVYDEVGYGSEIVSVDFDDFNKDGSLEVVFCWSLYDATSSKTMTVHSVDTTKKSLSGLHTIVNQSYSYMSIADIDSDGRDEIFVTWLDNTEQNSQKSYATLLKMTDEGIMTQLGNSVILDGSVSSYASLKLKTLDDGRAIAYLDAYKGESSMITEVLWWDERVGALVAPLISKDTLTNTATLRTPAIPSMDIDSDGRIEIPVNTAIQNAENADDKNKSESSNETQLSLTTWVNMTPNGPVPKLYSFVNSTVGYAFMLPESLKDYLLAYVQTDKGVTTVYLTDDGVARGEPLFTMLVKRKSEMAEDDSYTFRVMNDDYVVFGTITSAGEKAGFTNDSIEDSVIFIN